MSLGDRLARWWVHRKLRRGQCQWCSKPLPDTGSVVPDWQACSEGCADEIWTQRSF